MQFWRRGGRDVLFPSPCCCVGEFGVGVCIPEGVGLSDVMGAVSVGPVRCRRETLFQGQVDYS